MQVQQLLGEDLDELGVVHAQQVLQGFEVDVIGRVDGLRGAEDGVRDGDAAAQERGVFDVVDAGVTLIHISTDLRGEVQQ
jgi:hypothetical protein